ncbi:four helix bundle protein [Alkaliphilus serpentinus]|uniref:Four helix bundle protein n=1 Tax=Alkaliphilus serpentinus TaxID=1482731 RepID=A0A833M745_9FIRM|nr:four helix bundle protein [Alkaliphilus serpentinus]KAB3526646.1 four helix bundle protein [Alkaliphilus serpentinus]
MSKNIISDKSFEFSIKIVKLCKRLYQDKEYVVSHQLLKSGTSIGANIEEAQYAQSKKDFISKLSISLKEAAETRYWLRLLLETNSEYINELNDLLKECTDLIKLLAKAVKNSKLSL